jgi:hypothetical protein
MMTRSKLKTSRRQTGEAGWRLKAAQLDLEAKGIIVRESGKLLRLHLVKVN